MTKREKLESERVELLKHMHEIVRSINDEDAYMTWICLVPDCPTEEDFECIAEEDDDMQEIEQCFCRLIARYAAKTGFCV